MVVCLKPRLIRSGIERIENIGNSEEMITELGILPVDDILFLSKNIENILISKYYIYFIFWTSYIFNYHFLNSIGITRGRTPRFLRSGIKKIMKQVHTGENLIWQTYTNQFWKNWKTNYEFVYKAYFMKIAQLLKSSTDR